MGVKSKSASAFIMAIDLRGFSDLSPADHDRVIVDLYPEIARIVKVGDEQKLLDRKTIGDGFMFYFDAASDTVDAAMDLRRLFKDKYFWTSHKFEKQLSCRIGLHFGQFFWMNDAIEQREALFGRNIITVARLEPVVRLNEIWCTASFKAEADLNTIDSKIKFESLGNCELAKGWSREPVYALYELGETVPPAIQSTQVHRLILHDNNVKGYPNTYFALIRLKHRSDGIVHLKRHLSLQAGFSIEAIYDLFGAFDILVRFKSSEKLVKKEFLDSLIKGKIMLPNVDCKLTEIRFESDETKLKEPIVALPSGSTEYIKAFTYIESTTISDDEVHVHEVIDLARGACGNGNGVVTYYLNRVLLILPIVIRTSDYYALAKAVENIEALVDHRGWEDVKITTYPVHGLEELFPESVTT